MPSAKYLVRERALLAALGLSVASLAASAALPTALLSLALGVTLWLHHLRLGLLFAYVAVAALALALLCDALQLVAPRDWLVAVAVGGFIFGVLSALIFPLPVNLSRLRGDFQTIGCRTTRLGGVDCRVFYPSARSPSSVDAKRRVPYVHHGRHLAQGLSIVAKAPRWFFRTLDSAFLAAIADVPVAQASVSTKGWPLVVFSHGLGGSLEIYATIVQELASRGYVVVVLNHCDGSASVTRHADGRYELIQTVPRAVIDNTDGEGFRFRHRQLCQRVREVRNVLDAAMASASSDDVFQCVDFANVHVAGHSFGAATALSAAHEDERFRSAVLLDAWMMPVTSACQRGLGDRIPVLHLISEHFLVDRKENVDAIRKHTSGCSHPQTELLVLRKSHHNNFTDLPQFSPLVSRRMGAAGAIDPYYAERAIAEATVAFVGGARALSDVAKQFPELTPVY